MNVKELNAIASQLRELGRQLTRESGHKAYYETQLAIFRAANLVEALPAKRISSP